MKRKYITYGLTGALVVAGFVLLAGVSQSNSDMLMSLTEQAGLLGVLSYMVLMGGAVVVVPMSTVFLLPVAANSYGPLLAALYTIAGWTAGSMVAFYLARRYGVRLVSRFERIQKMREVEAALPRRRVFVIIVLLRSTLPVDVMSYALGLFSSIGYVGFFFSTVIGIAPFTFLISYASVGPVWLQVLAAGVGVVLLLSGVYYLYVRSKSTDKLTSAE